MHIKKEVAYAFNKFFFSIGKNLVTEHPNRYMWLLNY